MPDVSAETLWQLLNRFRCRQLLTAAQKTFFKSQVLDNPGRVLVMWRKNIPLQYSKKSWQMKAKLISENVESQRHRPLAMSMHSLS